MKSIEPISNKSNDYIIILLKPIFIVVFVAMLSNLFGQKQNIDPCALFKEAMSNNNIDTLDHYLVMDDSQLSSQDRINLMTFKGAAIIRKNSGRFRNGKTPQPSLIDSSYQLFTDAINMIDDEKMKVGYIYRRYETLEMYKPSYSGMSEDKDQLEKNGYKNDIGGFELHLTTKYDNEFWIGLEASIFGRLQSPFHFKDDYGATIKRSKRGKSMSGFTFSYLRNLQTNASESKFSIIKIEAPLYINITQVGYIKQAGQSYWFYRPELGLGYGRFSLSYGFNIFFKKSSSDVISRHSLNFNTKYIF